MPMNRQITLAARPSGLPAPSDFRLVESPVPEPAEGEIVVRNLYLSLDPYMRGRIRDMKSYAPPVPIGGVIVGEAVGTVVASRSPEFAPGDIAAAMTGWQEYAALPASAARKVDPSLAPVSTALGVLGMPGMTAYFGLLAIGQAKAGETLVVSGGAGAVGSFAGQVGKIIGCRVVGIAGSDDKVAYMTGELGFDAGYNYKSTRDHYAKLVELCPGGIDVYFDNVGGEITDAVFRHINDRARVAICGQISQYNLERPERGPRWLWSLIVHQARVEGFLVFQFRDRFPEAMAQMAGWLREGKMKYREHIAEGIENAPAAFIGMLQGANTGKQLVRLSAE
jgi:NADPH:quinone reductase